MSTPLEVSGGGSAQFRTHGGDNSIQNFGQEGGESELKAAGEALHGFLLARTNEEWPVACSYLSSAAAKQIEELGSRSGNGARKSCGEMLAALTAPLPTRARREVTAVDAVSLRQEGQRAFLIYRGEEEAHSKVYAITMARQGGVWKVAGLAPFPLG